MTYGAWPTSKLHAPLSHMVKVMGSLKCRLQEKQWAMTGKGREQYLRRMQRVLSSTRQQLLLERSLMTQLLVPHSRLSSGRSFAKTSWQR